MLERKKASGWLQGVPFDCTGMCFGGEWCLSGETASETGSSVLPRRHMVSLRKKEKQGWSRSAPQRANSDLLHEEAPGASMSVACQSSPVASKVTYA